ncbi:hypothetical protein K0M31_020324 [Melipona bicolor]|uniref:Uncharacterized protein n=1 Tax=Melipona bicolor TaxID=60889 RepID=A0AA40KQM8_9HYME|nr:hypothetical protein K0M31_020324 [Melipona bicolor]
MDIKYVRYNLLCLNIHFKFRRIISSFASRSTKTQISRKTSWNSKPREKNFTVTVADNQFPSEVEIDTSPPYATASRSFTENSRTFRIPRIQSIKLVGVYRRVCKFRIDGKLRANFDPWHRRFEGSVGRSEAINDEWQALPLRSYSCHFGRDLHRRTSVHFYACRLRGASGICETDDCFERSPEYPGGRSCRLEVRSTKFEGSFWVNWVSWLEHGGNWRRSGNDKELAS